MSKLTIDNVEINTSTLAVVEEAATALSPTMFAVTAVCTKKDNDHRVVVGLSRSPFKEVSELIVKALQAYAKENEPKIISPNTGKLIL